MKVLNPTIGTDFELFIQNENTSEIISAEGYIPGTKDQPFMFDVSNKFFASSLDNVLAEATIPPVTNAADFYAYIQKSMAFLKTQIPHDCRLIAQPAARLADKWLQSDHAKMFGCEPDYCVWTRSMNEPPCKGDNLRSAGGHIHVGYHAPTMETNEQIVKAMDLFLGVPSVIQEPDNERKSLYGKAGCFRFKEYGVEYRTISNYYLASKELTEWAFNNTMAAIQFVNNNGIEVLFYDEDIVKAINENNKELAMDLIRNFNIKLAA